MNRIILPLAAAWLISIGCSGKSHAPPSHGSDRRKLTVGGAYKVTYSTRPEPIPLNDHFSVEVSVASTDSADLPGDLSVQVDADMPAHGHGINTAPVIRRLDSGRFVAEGMLLHMPGEWELYVDVIQGPVRDRAIFPLILK